ncbi:hypothetical protein AC1031_009309 [Aphanomyces cochlioides]|nr:hypothetical protein AC1031_009309 [Aphanomyces cochlioides]
MRMSCLTQVAVGVAAVLTLTTALDTQPEHDGFTTYCWKSRGNPFSKSVNESDKLLESSDRGCPIQLRLDVGSVQVVNVLDPIVVNWIATYDLSANGLNLTKIYTIGSQKSPGDFVQIPHSNLHACEFGPRPCTPFDRGVNPTDNTANQELNFTSNRALFKEPELRFSNPGQYSLLAHIALPGENSSIRYDFAVYKKIIVKDGSTAAPSTTTTTSAPTVDPQAANTASENKTNTTLYAILGAVGALIVVAIGLLIYCCKKRRENSHKIEIESTVPTLEYRETGRTQPSRGYVQSDDSGSLGRPSRGQGIRLAHQQPAYHQGPDDGHYQGYRQGSDDAHYQYHQGSDDAHHQYQQPADNYNYYNDNDYRYPPPEYEQHQVRLR